MAQSIAQKLKIKEGQVLRTLDAPAGFEPGLQPLPPGVIVSETAEDYQQLHWFVRNRGDVDKGVPRLNRLLRQGVLCWVYFPKGGSGLQTDLTRDKGWEALQRDQYQWVNLVSFDATWSAFGLRLPDAKDLKKMEKPRERPVFDYVDPVRKTVSLPPDMEKALQASPGAQAFFDGLSFTNKKEYIEWVVGAKKEETRRGRVQATVERLELQWKNPANR